MGVVVVCCCVVAGMLSCCVCCGVGNIVVNDVVLVMCCCVVVSVVHGTVIQVCPTYRKYGRAGVNSDSHAHANHIHNPARPTPTDARNYSTLQHIA